MPYTQEYIKHLERQRKLFMAICVVAAAATAILLILIVRTQNLIQQQRITAIVNSCEDQNSRRAHTIEVLNREILLLPPKQRARAFARENYTILLINALAPHQNCYSLAHRVVKPVH